MVLDVVVQVVRVLRPALAAVAPKGEVTDNIAGLKSGIMSIAAGAIVLIAGLAILLDAFVLALYTVLDDAPLWLSLSPLLISVIVLAIGGIMLATGRNKLSGRALRPGQTLAETRRDRQMLKERLT